jgi:rhamnogalacturonan endolyase
MAITRRQMILGAAATVPTAKLAMAIGTPSAPTVDLPGTALLRDDFSKFAPGWLTYPFTTQGPAIQENHWVDARTHKFGQWSNGVADQDAWFVSMESSTNTSYMQQQLWHPPHEVSAVLIAGEDEWTDYDMEAMVRPLVFDGIAGIAFRYQTNLQYYVLGLTGGDTVQLNVQHLETKQFRVPNWETVTSAKFPYDTKRYYKLRVENRGAKITAYIDGNKMLETDGAIYAGGKIGLSANVPARFQNVKVDAAPAVKSEIAEHMHARNAKLAGYRAANPAPKLWKKFSVEGHGCASTMKMGDLNGDGNLELLLIQNIQTVSRDAYDAISCLTAVDLDGRILWQSGMPSKDPNNTWLTNDNPCQIHDVDGDGHAEVVCIRDFQIQILDGRTGKIKKWSWMPAVAPLPEKHPDTALRPYELQNGDSLFFVNVSGNRNRQEIFIKDRYQRFWIFDNDLKFLWGGEGQTGHCPYFFDVDGYDRIQMGYSMWDHTGKLLWSHDKDLKDHSDSIAIVNMTDDPNAPLQVYSTGSDEGYLRFSYDSGKIESHSMIGHAQASSIGKYRMDLPGLQFAMIDFHWNPGITLLYDAQGNMLKVAEPIHNGSKMAPANWRGDGQEFILLSTDPKYGGMVNGNFEREVMFPNDGHPDLACFATDITGDGRDDVITWDDKSVWIYTQDKPFIGERMYAPTRNPLYNYSNYSCIVSKPGWRKV